MSNSTIDQVSHSDNMMMMMMVSIVVPVITSAVGLLMKTVIDRLSNISTIIQDWKTRTNSVVTITQTATSSPKRTGWQFHPDETYNGKLIISILEYLTKQGLCARSSSLNLGDCVVSAHKTGFSVSNPMIYNPIGDVACGDFIIHYTRSLITRESGLYELQMCMNISSKLSAKSVRIFIDTCYKEYIDNNIENTDDICHLYKQIPSKSGIRFKKYPIKNNTIFDDMYFPEKEKVIELFAKLSSGDLKKLSFMLHGIPGSGKTSFIKSVANHLNYDIIEVKLAYMMHDGELMDIFHTESIISFQHNDAKDEQVDYVPINKRIYIFEDIDAESDVVHQRKPIHGHADIFDTSVHGALCINDEDNVDNHYKKIMKLMSKDKLTLSGVLNAIDGILEINGSIIIMTTNHPEKLDDALVRPGRITMKIKMGKMYTRYANEMIKKKFGSTIVDFPDAAFTPAELESYCQIASSIDELRSMINRLLV